MLSKWSKCALDAGFILFLSYLLLALPGVAHVQTGNSNDLHPNEKSQSGSVDSKYELVDELIHGGDIRHLEFSHDGTKLATASLDKFGRIWDVRTGQESFRFAHDGAVTKIRFSADDSLIATSSYDKSVVIWDANTGRELIRLLHSSSVRDVIFSPDSKTVATIPWEWNARIWDIETGAKLLLLEHDASLTGNDLVRDLAFSDSGEIIATGSNDFTVRLWDARTGEQLQLVQHEAQVGDVEFSPDQLAISSASTDGSVRVWEIDSGEELFRLDHGRQSVSEVNYSPDGLIIATQGSTSEGVVVGGGREYEFVRIWDSATGEPIRSFYTDAPVHDIEFNHDGSILATSTWGKLILWKAESGEEILTIKSGDHFVFESVFSPNSDLLATRTDEKIVRIWKLNL